MSDVCISGNEWFLFSAPGGRFEKKPHLLSLHSCWSRSISSASIFWDLPPVLKSWELTFLDYLTLSLAQWWEKFNNSLTSSLILLKLFSHVFDSLSFSLHSLIGWIIIIITEQWWSRFFHDNHLFSWNREERRNYQ